MAEFNKVVIFGVGLIGGSFALGLRAAGAVEEVVGFGRDEARCQKGRQVPRQAILRGSLQPVRVHDGAVPR